MTLLMLSISPVYLLFSYIVAEFVGAHRKIGLWWTLFFSITFSPVIGLIFALCSVDKRTVTTMSPFGQTLAYVLAGCSLMTGLIILFIGLTEEKFELPYFLVSAGFLGGKIYGLWKLLGTPKRDD